MDGNVLRVTARLADDHGDIASPAVKRAAAETVRAAMPRDREDIRIFNRR